MAADDTDTGSFTAPTRGSNAAAAAAGPSAMSQAVDASEGQTAGEHANGAGTAAADSTASPSTSKQRRGSPMAVDNPDGNESTASTCELGNRSREISQNAEVIIRLKHAAVLFSDTARASFCSV